MAVWHIQRRVLSEGSISSKNVLSNSSGLGVAFLVWVLITLEIIVFGYPFDTRAALTCCNSFNLPSSVVGRLRDLLIRVLAVLILCFKSTWCVYHIKTLSLRLKLRYESSLTKRKILSARTLPAF